MSKCRDCGEIVVFLRKPGGWLPPVEPVLDFADGEYVLMGPNGEGIVLPQVFRKHRCVAEEGADPEDLADRRAQREIAKLDRQAERERMLAEADFRRKQIAAQQRMDLEAAQIESDLALQAKRDALRAHAEAAEERRLVDRREQQLFAATEKLEPRFGSVKCPHCGSEPGEPCKSSRAGDFYIVTPHPARRNAAPPAPRIPQKRRWGDDYTGPWPPQPQDDQSGWKIMRRWLTVNASIFQTPVQTEKETHVGLEESAVDRDAEPEQEADPRQEEERGLQLPNFIQPGS